jgi:hypothetical protein
MAIDGYDSLAMLSLEIGRYANIPMAMYHRLTSSPKTFLFCGRKYHYFFHAYNKTWANERTIEIPLALEMVNQNNPHETLEIGNVLSHYMKTEHTIVDKYEKRKGVLNRDVTTLDTHLKYSLIVSISTLEHVGWDEIPREPGKHRVALGKMIALLKPGGRLFVTIPLGYNPGVDQDLFQGVLFGPYKAANALAVLSYIRP